MPRLGHRVWRYPRQIQPGYEGEGRPAQLRAARGTEHQAPDDLSGQGAQPESGPRGRADRRGSLARREGREAGCMTARKRWVLSALALMSTVAAAGCARGCTSSRPPIHINPSMDDQPKMLAHTASTFFFDGSSMRQPV